MPRKPKTRVASSVATFGIEDGRAVQTDDVRLWGELDLAEFPWPLRFYFVAVAEGDGMTRWESVGFELGGPVSRRSLQSGKFDVRSAALTADHWELLARNLSTYQRVVSSALVMHQAEIPWEPRELGRRWGDRWTNADRELLARQYLALKRAGSREVMYSLEDFYGLNRTTIYRELVKAEELGFLEKGVVPRRQRLTASAEDEG